MLELTKEEIVMFLQLASNVKTWQGERGKVKESIAILESAEEKLKAELAGLIAEEQKAEAR